MRVCIYLSSDDDFYSSMVLTSINMLRLFNREIKIRVFVIGGYSLIDKHASEFGLEVIHKESRDPYFCLNRQYLTESEEDSVLYIDGDTFVFGNIETLFERYKNVDFAAATDDWIVGQPDWRDDQLQESFALVEAEPGPIFNGGLMFWNNRTIRNWELDKYCKLCQDLPISNWLYGNNRQCYHRETFAICFHVAKQKLKYSIMDDKDVVNLFSQKDLTAWGNGKHLVYHCFTQNWEKFACKIRSKR